jgi:hypothetical protein
MRGEVGRVKQPKGWPAVAAVRVEVFLPPLWRDSLRWCRRLAGSPAVARRGRRQQAGAERRALRLGRFAPSLRAFSMGWLAMSEPSGSRKGKPGESNGGGRGIRTPGTVSRTAIFKTAAFNRSAIPPRTSIIPRD